MSLRPTLFTVFCLMCLSLFFFTNLSVPVFGEMINSQVFGENINSQVTSVDLQNRTFGSFNAIDWNEDMSIRIGVMEKQKTIKVSCETPLIFSSQGEQVVLEGKTEYSFRVKTSKPARLAFHPVVRTVPAKKKEVLTAELNKWNEGNLKAKLCRAGGKIKFRKMLIHDNSRYYVALPSFSSKEDCEASFQHIQKRAAHKPWPLEILETAATGTMELVDKTGIVLATFDKPVSITSKKHIKVFDVEYGVGYSWHGYQNRHFRGQVEIRIDKTGNLQFVNELDIENYIKGVVPSEMSANYPIEALCAQAIAARGETLAKYGVRHLADPYFLCSAQHCQVYGGVTKEHANTNKAVEDTSGRILRAGSHIADTVYSACCGGHTESNENVWSTDASSALRGVADLRPDATPFPVEMTKENLKKWWTKSGDGWCSFSSPTYASRYRWKADFTRAKLNSLVEKKYPAVGDVIDLIPLKRGLSGKLVELKIVGLKNMHSDMRMTYI